jgi:hypothetical protein
MTSLLAVSLGQNKLRWLNGTENRSRRDFAVLRTLLDSQNHMEVASAQIKPFQGYIGKRVLLRRTVAEIVDIKVRGQVVCFVGKEADSRREFLVPLRCLLEHLIEENAQPSADMSSHFE